MTGQKMDAMLAATSPDEDEALGVSRINKLPLVIVTVVCLILLAVLVYAGWKRAEQKQDGIGISSKLEATVEPVEAGQAAADLFRDYYKQPEASDSDRDDSFREESLIIPDLIADQYENDDFLPDYAEPLDQSEIERQELEKDARMAATVVPTEDLYRPRKDSYKPQAAKNIPLASNARSSGKEQEDVNLRRRKELFKQTEIHYGYSTEPRREAPSPFILRVGSVIPAVLISGINSELPGEVFAQVSHDVRDSRTGRHVLIPHGTTLVGVYDHHIAMGQERLMTVWHRLRFPDDSTLNMGGMAGTDQAGYTGFKDRVNNHFFKIFANASLLALISAGSQMAVPASDADADRVNRNEILAAEAGRQWGEIGREMVRRNLKIQPTLEIRPGYRFNVMVDKDLILPPYTG